MSWKMLPQSDSTEKAHMEQYNKLVSKLKYQWSKGIRKSFELVYENAHGKIDPLDKPLMINSFMGYQFNIWAKIDCESCGENLPDLFLMKEEQENRYPPWEFWHYCSHCNKPVRLHVIVRNLGVPVKANVKISIQRMSSEPIDICNIERYFEKSDSINEYWKFGPSLSKGCYIRGCGNYDNYGYGGDYFKANGDLTLICNITLTENENQMPMEMDDNNDSQGVYARMADQFSDANINPSTNYITSPVELTLTDVILRIGEDKIHCHKFVLALSSSFFNTMFASGMKESQSQEIELKDVSLETMKLVLSYMYTDKIDEKKIVPDLLRVSDMYGIVRLKNICSQRLSRIINVLNVAEIWEVAYMHNVEDLSHDALIFMVKNWNMLVKDDDIRKLCKNYINLLFTISALLAETQKN